MGDGERGSKREQEGKRNCYTELKLRVCKRIVE